MNKCSSSTDFQTELLRINGTLQASITELRYHCEVYRLSLKSICKVLSNVHEDQNVRLRCLNSSRPSFHAYLLNLSQKHALDRIRNVVKKASSFINGYSLVDQRLFLPPPPNPASITRRSADSSRNTPTPTAKEVEVSNDVIEDACISNSDCLTNPVNTFPNATDELNQLEEGEIISNENPEEESKNSSSSQKRRRKEKKKREEVSRTKSRFAGRESGRSSRSSKYSSQRNNGKEMKHSKGENSVSSKNDIRDGRRTSANVREKTTSSKPSRRSSRLETASEAVKRSLERVRSKSITATAHRHYHELRHRNQTAINFREHATSNDGDLKEGVTKIAVSSFRVSHQLGRKQTSCETLARNKIPALLSIFTTNGKSVQSFVGTKSAEKRNNKFRGLDARRERRPSREKLSNEKREINKCNIKRTERLNQSSSQTRRLSGVGDRRRCGSGGTGEATSNTRRQREHLQERQRSRISREGRGPRRTHLEHRRGYSTYVTTVDRVKERLARVRSGNSSSILRQGQTIQRKYSFASMANERKKAELRNTKISNSKISDRVSGKVKRIRLFEN